MLWQVSCCSAVVISWWLLTSALPSQSDLRHLFELKKSWEHDAKMWWWFQWARMLPCHYAIFPSAEHRGEMQNKRNEKSEPDIPWAVIHTDVDGIACWTLVFSGEEGGEGLLIAKLKNIQPKTRAQAPPQMKFKESTNIIAFYRMATHLNLFSGLTSWMASKTSFCVPSADTSLGLLRFVLMELKWRRNEGWLVVTVSDVTFF